MSDEHNIEMTEKPGIERCRAHLAEALQHLKSAETGQIKKAIARVQMALHNLDVAEGNI